MKKVAILGFPFSCPEADLLDMWHMIYFNIIGGPSKKKISPRFEVGLDGIPV